MNKKFIKLLACVLAIIMVGSILPISVFAAEDDGITIINESKAVSDNKLYVSCDYNSSTEGYGVTKFSNYAGAYAYAIANGKTNATIVVEKTNTLSGNTFDNNHKNYNRLAVVIKDGATMGNAASKWDMTYPVTVEPGGTLTCARPKNSSVSYIHVKNTLTVGAEGATKKAVVDFLSDSYQDCDISIRYNGKVIVNNADFRVQDLDAQGTLTITDSDVYVDGAFASATFYATTLTDSTLTVKGNQISGGISDFAGGTSNRLGNMKINNSTLNIEDGTTTVAANVTVSGDSDFFVCKLTVNSGKKITANDTAKIEVGTLTNNGTIIASATATVSANVVSEGSTGKVTIGGVDAELGNNGQFGVSVAKIGTQGYATLADAIANATAGQTITLLDDITEDVTINKAITIDGADKTYTGAMILTADTTIKNVNFDGKGYNGYAVNTRGASYVTIEDCTAKNYGYGFVQLASATVLTTVKNVTVSNMNYGVKVDYSGAVVIENADITAGVAAVLNSNYGEKTITIKDSKLNILGTWTRNNTIKTTYVFEGANTIGQFIIDAAIDVFELAAGATLTAPNEVTVVTDVEDGTVVYEDGKYYVQTGLAGSGTNEDPYQIGSVEDLIKFRDSVNAGETKYNAPGVYVALTADIDLADIDWSVNIGDDCNATFDGIFDGKGYTIKNLTSTETAQKADGYICAGLFGAIAGEAVIKNLTIENVTINTGDFTGNNASAVVGFAYNATGSIENVTVKGNIQINANKVDGVGAIVGYAYGGKLTVKNCVVDGAAVTRSASAVNGQAYVGGIIGYAGGKITLSDNTTQNVAINASSCAAGGVAGIILGGGVASNNTVKNVTMTSAHANWQNAVGTVAGTFTGNITVSGTVAENNSTDATVGVLHADKPTAPLGKAQAAIGDVYYGTFADAYTAAKDGDVITLLAPIVVNAGETLTLDKNVTITYTSNAVGEDMITVRGTLNVVAGKITYVNNSNGSNVTVSTISAEPGSVVNVIGGIIENKSVKADGSSSYPYAIDMLTNGSLGDVTVTISGGTVYSDYMAIRQFNNGTVCKNSLTVTGGEIYGAKRAIQVHLKNDAAYLEISGGKIEAGEGGYALCLFPETATHIAVTGGMFIGTVYSGTNGIISGGIYSEELYADYLKEGLVLSKNANGTYGIVVPVASVNGVNYATLTDAIKAATAGQTITLLADVNENVTIDKSITIDGADKNYTGTMTINNNLTVTVQNVNFVNGGIAKATKSTNGNYTIKGCTFDGEGEYAYALSFKGANKITVEDCTVSNYMYGFLYVSSAAINTSVKNVTVENCPNYAVYFGSGVNTASFENLTVKNSNNGFILNNTANRAFTIKNCTMENVGTAINHSKGTNTITCIVLGVNDFGGAALSNYANVLGVQIGTKIYATLAGAWVAAQDGDTIKLLNNIDISEGITNTKKVTLDLNGKTITGTDNATGSFALITNKGELTITGNGKITLTATNNRAWNAYSSVISNTVGGKLVVENGTIEHLGGTDMAYAIDNLTNGKGTYAETVINGGTIKSTYRAIRMFLNGVEAQNILTVNGGVIEGANKSIWMQDPSAKANTGKLTVDEGATLNGDVYLTVTEGSTEWPVEVSIAASAVNGEVLTNANVPECYVLENVNGTWEVNKYAVVIGGQYYFETLADAVVHAQNRNVLKLLCDSEGPGIVINKNITIDFNGYTYTLTEDAVGSSNTKTNGFQILKGNTVEFKNGTIKVADEAASKYAMLIQNYANLKIRNMTLDGTNLDYSSKVSYVVSINSGRVYFIGDVVVKSNDRNLAGDVAIDVYDYSAAGYDVPTVDIPDTVKIDEYATIADAAKAGKVLAAARAGKVFYASIQQAIDNSASFSLVQDYVGPGFVIDKQVNINLAGFTLTINEGVGSANTKTNGIQILKGAKVGLSNGKIEAADNGKLAILIQNYGDVQITNVELDGTNLDYSSKVSFTLSINSGNVKLMGTTKVIANSREGANDIAIDVYDYSAAGYELPIVSIYSTVTYTEGKLHAAAKYGNYYYSSLQQCIDKHGTATLVCDFEGPGVVFNKNATIHFNGYTYTFTSGVGSTGTESNGFQILKGNRVTLNNGTLKVADSAADKFYTLIQNYGDLTLNSMTLDGTNLDKWSKTDGDSYTLSINSGNVNINGTTKIIANNDGDKAFAFDVCDKTAAGYNLPLVKVAATATIEGNIEAAVKIGNRYYATLAQAIADRDNGSSKDELVLMSNIVLKETLVIEASKAIVLDLNGYTLSQEKACTGHYAMIVNKAILTIKDSVGGGKISFTDTGAGDPNFGWGSYTIVNENKLYVNGGTIENLSAQNANGSVKHMYCAIQQNNDKAQLQINGGTISTPSYRSIRINRGSLTFGAWATTEEGATIEGQVWIQPFADGIKVNINNGKFSPAGVDSSSIYVDNSSKTVAFRINGGSFETKIGCANADALKSAIRGGSFTEAAIEKTNATLFHKNFVNK